MITKLKSIRVLLLSVTLAFLAALAGCASTGHGAQQARPGQQPNPVTASEKESGEDGRAVDERQAARQEDGGSSATGDGPNAISSGWTHEPATDRVVHVRGRMEEAFQSGLEAYQAGRFDEAKEHFDNAVDAVLTSGIELSDEPALRAAFNEVVRNVGIMDADLYTKEDAGRVSDAPFDALQDITSYLSPKEAERERRRIEEFTAEVTYDLPMVLNPKVLSFVEIFQTRLRKEFEAGRKRSGMYLPLIKKVFREEGIPEDLA